MHKTLCYALVALGLSAAHSFKLSELPSKDDCLIAGSIPQHAVHGAVRDLLIQHFLNTHTTMSSGSEHQAWNSHLLTGARGSLRSLLVGVLWLSPAIRWSYSSCI